MKDFCMMTRVYSYLFKRGLGIVESEISFTSLVILGQGPIIPWDSVMIELTRKASTRERAAITYDVNRCYRMIAY